MRPSTAPLLAFALFACSLAAPRPNLFSNSDKDEIFPLDGVVLMNVLEVLDTPQTAALIEPSPERPILRGRFVFRTYAGKVRRDRLDRDDSEKPCWTHPVVAHGRLFPPYQDSIS